jgi:hypothetical protein
VAAWASSGQGPLHCRSFVEIVCALCAASGLRQRVYMGGGLQPGAALVFVRFVTLPTRSVRIRPPDPTRRQHPTIPSAPRRDATTHVTTRLKGLSLAEPPIAPLFHSKSLNCNLWYLLDLLSNKAFDIAPLSIELAPSPTRSSLTYKARSYLASYGHYS